MRIVFMVASILVAMETGVSSQRTYMRHCDCEYTVDGKCAYTLLLPQSSESTCSTSESPSSDIESLKSNVSSLLAQTLENAHLLSQLQGSVLYVMQELQNFKSSNVSNENATLDGEWQKNVTTIVADTVMSVYNLTTNVHQMQERMDEMEEEMDSLKQTVVRLTERFDSINNGDAINETQVAENLIDRKIAELRNEIDTLRSQQCVMKVAVHSTMAKADAGAVDVMVNVSSQFNEMHGPDKVQVDLILTPGAWCPGELHSFPLISWCND